MNHARQPVHFEELEGSLQHLAVKHRALERDRRRIRSERRELDAAIVEGLANYLKGAGEGADKRQALAYATDVLGFSQSVALRRLHAAHAANLAPDILMHLRAGRLTFAAIEVLGADVASQEALELALGRSCRLLGIALEKLRGSLKSGSSAASAVGKGDLRPDDAGPVNENREPASDEAATSCGRGAALLRDAGSVSAEQLVCSCCIVGSSVEGQLDGAKRADSESKAKIRAPKARAPSTRSARLRVAAWLLRRFGLGGEGRALEAPRTTLFRRDRGPTNDAHWRSKAHAVLGSANFVRHCETCAACSGLCRARGPDIAAET